VRCRHRPARCSKCSGSSPSWVSFVVGVHFIGLAKVWHESSLGWVGTGIAVLGALGLGLASAGASAAAIASIAGVCPGALLLAGSWWSVARSKDSVMSDD
jgi:hypothetical protein